MFSARLGYIERRKKEKRRHSPLVMLRRTRSFSQEAKEASRASVIFLLVPGVNGGTCAGISETRWHIPRLIKSLNLSFDLFENSHFLASPTPTPLPQRGSLSKNSKKKVVELFRFAVRNYNLVIKKKSYQPPLKIPLKKSKRDPKTRNT